MSLRRYWLGISIDKIRQWRHNWFIVNYAKKSLLKLCGDEKAWLCASNVLINFSKRSLKFFFSIFHRLYNLTINEFFTKRFLCFVIFLCSNSSLITKLNLMFSVDSYLLWCVFSFKLDYRCKFLIIQDLIYMLNERNYLKFLSPFLGFLFCPVTIILLWSFWSAPKIESETDLIEELKL